MDTKTILATLTRAMLASIAGALVHHGVMQSSGTEAFIGAGMLLATGAWGLWNGYGKDIAKAAGDILRAKVMNAAARAQETPALAPQALASLAAHVEATTPEAAPASPGGAQTALMLALTLSTLALAWAGPAGAQGVQGAQRAQAAPVTRAAVAEPVAPRPAAVRPPICDPLNLLPGCHVEIQSEDGKSGPSSKPVELDIWGKITGAALPDLEYASMQAAAAGTPGAGVRKQCWDALILANKQASGTSVKNADGTAATRPDKHLFTDVESLAEVLDNLAPGGPLWTACAGAAGLARTNALTFINAAVTGAAGMAALGVT